MIYAFIAAAFLVLAGIFAAALADTRKKAHAAVRQLERATAERLEKLEAAVSAVTPETSVRNLATMVEGVTSVSRRMENRLTALESRLAPPRESGGG